MSTAGGAEAADAAPPWMRPLRDLAAGGLLPPGIPRRRPGFASRVSHRTRPRDAAVLVLFGGSRDAPGAVAGRGDAAPAPPADAEVLLTHRAPSLRSHSGQVSFPGGRADPEDDGPVSTALRETHEETGLAAAEVRPLEVLEPLYIPVSNYDVRPVLGYWPQPRDLGPVDRAEVARVLRVPLAELRDPAHRFVVRHPLGYQGPAFRVDDLVVWGFTAGVLSGLLTGAGWESDWDRDDVRDLDETLRSSANNESAILDTDRRKRATRCESATPATEESGRDGDEDEVNR